MTKLYLDESEHMFHDVSLESIVNYAKVINFLKEGQSLHIGTKL